MPVGPCALHNLYNPLLRHCVAHCGAPTECGRPNRRLIREPVFCRLQGFVLLYLVACLPALCFCPLLSLSLDEFFSS